MNKRAQVSTIVLIILIILTGAIIYIGLSLLGAFEDKEIDCSVDEPFTCKKVIITDKSQDAENLLNNYVILEVEDVGNVEVVPGSIISNSCNNAFVIEVTNKSSNAKEIKILLSCYEGGKDEVVNGDLEIVYTLDNGNVRNGKLKFNVKRVESSGNVFEKIKEDIFPPKPQDTTPLEPTQYQTQDENTNYNRGGGSGGGGGGSGGGGSGGGESSNIICTAGSIQTGTQCNVCNLAGTAYIQDNSKCVLGQTCDSIGQCTILCINECVTGEKECSTTSNGYQTCGNYDADSCLEWSTVTSCLSEQTCSSGNCVVTPKSSLWVSAYLNSWDLNVPGTSANYGVYTVNTIDWDAFTHIILFATSWNTDGTCCSTSGNWLAPRLTALTAAGHSHGKPVIFSIGGSTDSDFAAVLNGNAALRTTAINNLVNFMNAYKFDGVDLDPEQGSFCSGIAPFVTELRTKLNQQNAYYDTSKKPIITAAVMNCQSQWASVASSVDQLNIMSYDMSGTWWGETWHNNAAKNVPGTRSDGVITCDTVDWSEANGECMNTIQKKVQTLIKAGIPNNKIGAGVDFNGFIWQGGTKSGGGYPITPRDTWTSTPSNIRLTSASCGQASGGETVYRFLKKCYLDPNPSAIKWDSLSQVSYYGNSNIYITYQDEQSVRNAVKAIKEMGIGGMIVWEIGGGYLDSSTFPSVSSPRDPLLQALKSEVFGGTTCIDDCTTSGEKQCSTLTGYQTCGDYDADSCLEWNSATECPIGQTCTSNGQCIAIGIIDNQIPSVTISSPINNAAFTTSTITVSGTATDNIALGKVEVKVNNVLQKTITISGTSATWSTTVTLNSGINTIQAQAIDAKDLVSLNSIVDVAYNPIQYSDKIVYQDQSLNSPWIDASWDATNTLNSAEQIYSGSSSLKTVLNAWGAVRPRHGNWGAGITLDPSLYSSLQLRIHGGTTGGQIRVLLGNDVGGVFTAYSTTIPESQWTLINIPMDQLNPNNNIIHSFYIQNSASSQKTFYLDDIKFVS